MSNPVENFADGKVEAKPVGEWFEDMPLTRVHWMAGLTLFVAFVIEAWEMMILILNSSSIATEFNLEQEKLGFLISAIFLGMIPGSLVWGKLAGSIGRRKSLIYSIGLYSVFPILSALAPSYEVLWVVRFLCGVIISGALVVTFPLFTELLPVKVRGKATVYLSAGWPVGMLAAILITVLFGEHSWRWSFGVSSILGLWAIMVFKFVPKSPYWLAEEGRVAEADAVITRLSGGAILPVTQAVEGSIDEMKISDIFSKDILRLTIIQTLVNFCFAWGYWGLTSWLPTLLSERGLSTKEGLGFLALSALFMFPGYICASFLTGRYGRKTVMASFIFCSTLAGFGLAFSETLNQMYFWNFLLSFFSLGAWGVWNTWLGEIYSTRQRGAGVAWGVMTQRVANTIAPVVIGSVIARGNFLQTVSFISAFLLITFVLSLLIPETEGKALS